MPDMQDMTEITVASSVDQSEEPSLFWFPENGENAPLLVGLHTWSADRFNQVAAMLPLCRERGWALLLPEFRGPNLETNPRAAEACASALAKRDILDAIERVCGEYSIDRSAIFLLGGSGGGHMSLATAAAAPHLWRGVSSWCPITDIEQWYYQNAGYAMHVAACCGGKPGASFEADREYHLRSPINQVAQLARVTLSVHHGRHDHSVPFTHTLQLAEAIESIGPGRFYFEIFDGGHELHHARAFAWFDRLLGSGDDAERLTR